MEQATAQGAKGTFGGNATATQGDAKPETPSTNGTSLRERILFADDKPEIREVDVPQWGFKVFVRGMTATQRDQWEAEQIKIGKNGKTEFTQENIRAGLVARCVCDADGNTVLRKDDIPRLGQKSAAAIDLLFGVAKELSGISQKDVDELEDGLKNVPSGDGFSA